MKTRIYNQLSFLSIVEYLFVLVLTINCNTIWTSYEESPINRILKVIVVIVTMLYLVTNKKSSFHGINKMQIFCVLAIIYILIYSIIVSYNIFSFLCFVIDVSAIYIFTIIAVENKRGFKILSKYSDIILAIAIVSLVFWLGGSVMGIIHPTGYVYSTWTGNDMVKSAPTYYNVYFETQYIMGFARNTAIFTEAPMCSFNLCVALLIELFCKCKISKIRCFIIIITIITTISTTGICMAIIVLLAKFVFNRSSSGTGRVIKAVAVPALLVIGFIAVQTLVQDKLGTSSGNTRMDDFIAGYKAWKTHPIFGAGFGNRDCVKHYMSPFRWDNVGFSNSVMLILANGGIFLAIPYIWFAYKWIQICIKRKNIQWFLFFASFMYLFTFTVVPYKFLPIFIFMAYDFVKEKNLNQCFVKAKHNGKTTILKT